MPANYRLITDATGQDIVTALQALTPSSMDLDDLGDVSVSNLQNNQILKYNSTSAKWENANESGGSVVTTIQVSTSNWATDTTSQSGTTLYKKQITLNHIYSAPSVDIGAASGYVLPTVAEQTAYDLVQYVTVDDTVPCLYLYASDIPTTAFYINVKGVD